MSTKIISFETLEKLAIKTFEMLQTKSDINHEHSYNELQDTPTIPSKVSELTNDTGYITNDEIDLSNVATKEELNAKADKEHTHDDICSSIDVEGEEKMLSILDGDFCNVTYTNDYLARGNCSTVAIIGKPFTVTLRATMPNYQIFGDIYMYSENGDLEYTYASEVRSADGSEVTATIPNVVGGILISKYEADPSKWN